MMKKVFVLVLGITLLSVGQAHAATKLTFSGRVHDVANFVKQALLENPLLKGQKVALGTFDGEGPKAFNSNFGLEIQRRLGELLTEFRNDESDFTLAGNY